MNKLILSSRPQTQVGLWAIPFLIAISSLTFHLSTAQAAAKQTQGDLFHTPGAKDPSLKIPAEVQNQLQHQWGEIPQNTTGEKLLYFFPRLFGRPLQYVLTGQLAHRVKNFGTLFYYGPSLDGLTNSVLNPFGDANDAVSDGVSIVKSARYVLRKRTSRIQACTGMLGFPLFDPMEHVQISVDGMNEEGHPIRAENCQPTYLSANESESVAMERLFAERQDYESHLEFFTNNCGGIAHDRLSAAKLGFPVYANYGIGNEITGPGTFIERRKQISRDIELGDQNLALVRAVILALENGDPLSADQATWLRDTNHHSPDFMLQLVISAARGKNASNRMLVAQKTQRGNHWNQFWNLTSTPTIKSNLTKTLKKMFVGMSAEGYRWMQANYASEASGPLQLFNQLLPGLAAQFR